MCLNTDLEIRLCRCNLKRRTSRRRRMCCSPSCVERYCRVMMVYPFLDAWVPVEQAGKVSSWPR